MSDCMVVRSSRIGSVKDNLSCSMEGRTTTENQENLYEFTTNTNKTKLKLKQNERK